MNKLFKTLAASVLGLALAAGVGVGVAGGVKTTEVSAKAIESNLTFTKACGGSGTASDGATWTIESDAAESAYDKTKGIHYGTSSAAVSYLNLTSSDYDKQISKIVVNASGASKTSATISCTVGGDDFGTQAQALTSSDAEYTFSGEGSGEVVVSLNQTSEKKALYVKSVVVTYDDGQASIPVTGVTMDEKSVTMLAGKTHQLTATVAPEDASNQNVEWSSDDEDVATVDENGLVTAVSTGNATITVTTEDGGFTDTCDVTVEENPYKVDNLNVTTLGFASSYGDTEEKTISCSASYMANGMINESVNMQMRTTNSNSGIVTLKTGGLLKSATVTVASGTNTWQILGNNNAYTSPTNLYDSEDDVKGTVLTSSATSATYEFDTDYQYFGFRSANGAIYISSIVLEWEPVKPTSITADDSIQLTLGSKSQIEHELVNEDGYIVSETGVTFSSNNPCVTVSETGLVEGVSAGEAVVTITSNADETVKKEIPVTVSAQKINVESVTLNKNELELQETHGEQLTYTLLPEDASVQDVTWSSDGEGVATVDQDGNVLAISEGTATIKVESDDDPTKYDECVVTVVEREKVYFELVDEASKLVNGAQYVIAGEKDSAINVMGHYASGNNIKSSGAVLVNDDDHIYGIKEEVESVYYTLDQNAEGYWTMFDGAKYLFAAGGTNVNNNYLRAKDTIEDSSKWDITFNGDKIDVASRGGVTNNNMRYNSGNDLFSCYGYDEDDNPKQSQLYLYRVIHTAGTAEAYAEYFLEDTNAICLTGTNHYDALNAKWSTYAANYDLLDGEEKAKFLVETPAGVIKNMLDRYDYLVAKYGFTQFIDGHVVNSVNTFINTLNNNNTMMIVIVSVAVASISLLGVTIFLKKKRAIH